tara:strand:- start:1556 stop:1951 length:396 start_codon:yes stop_codon:yes gene_type:complete
MNDQKSKHIRNKEIVLDFYKIIFEDKQPLKAIERHVGDTYTQHNPDYENGPEAIKLAFPAVIEANPDMSFDIKRVVAEGDLVVLHSHYKPNRDDRGLSIMDIFRLEDEKIVEHWDVLQPVPENSANKNTMF